MASIFVSYPTYRYAEPESKNCLEKMMMYMSQKKHRVGFDSPVGESMITRVRNRSLSRFIRDGSFDWFLTIDSDILFDEDLLEKLLSHNKEVIGAVYRVKQNKIASACTPVQKPGTAWRDKTIEMNNGVQEMWYLSGGCMLVNMSVIMEMVSKFPELKYYDDYSDEECWGLYSDMIIEDGEGKNRFLSEDWAFCERMSQIGLKLYADTDIRLGHMIMTVLTFPKKAE